MRKVKIVCTIGPACSSPDMIQKMINNGMNIARLNFSHGTHSEHKTAAQTIKRLSLKHDSPVAILQDLKGLKIRVGPIKGGAVYIKKNSVLALTPKNIEGNSSEISVSYPYLIKDVAIGDTILLDDGLLQLKVKEKKRDRLITKVIEGGLLREKKGVNLPGASISGSIFTEKDRKDLEFGLKIGVDYVALSFVR
ncbi:MAG TPA: pyruvate kinase, partial [Nitrospirae bacterium]|nr:pyruvate kinase [Nitrospirota bacterium]